MEHEIPSPCTGRTAEQIWFEWEQLGRCSISELVGLRFVGAPAVRVRFSLGTRGWHIATDQTADFFDFAVFRVSDFGFLD